jgi:cation transport regulator ChaB
MMTITPEELAEKELELAKKEQELLAREKELLEKQGGSDDEKLNALVDAKLKEVKEKLDGAYTKRDEALKKVAEFEAKEREAELARLKEAGKHHEAFEIERATLQAEKEALEKRNIELTRDNDVRMALNGLDKSFRNEKAVKVAFREISDELVKNDKGEWLHKSGATIEAFVKTFSDDETNGYLFKVVTSSGGDLGGNKNNNNDGKKVTSLFAMKGSEVLQLAKEGKLPNQRK